MPNRMSGDQCLRGEVALWEDSPVRLLRQTLKAWQRICLTKPTIQKMRSMICWKKQTMQLTIARFQEKDCR